MPNKRKRSPSTKKRAPCVGSYRVFFILTACGLVVVSLVLNVSHLNIYRGEDDHTPTTTNTVLFGSREGAALRSRLRREQHQALVGNQRNRMHVNFLDMLSNRHLPGNKNKHNNKNKPYRIDKSGMLQAIGGSGDERVDYVTNMGNNSNQHDQNHQGYAPTGGALPKPQNGMAMAEQRRDFGEWSRVDKFTCLTNSTTNSSTTNTTSTPVHAWQTRAPYVIILGTMKGGTQALTSFLWQNQRFVKKDKGMEIHFFGNLDYQQTAMGIPVEANQRAYAVRFQSSHSHFFRDPQMRAHAKPLVLAVDSTPSYLMHTDRVPQAICCVAPWAKLVALLRNPVDRVESHYRYLHESRWRNRRAMVDWDTWIQHDLGLLRETGVVHDQTIDGDTAGSQAEFEAWKRYLHHPENSQQIVGRGLYVIQLEHYFKVLDACPSKSREDLLVLRSEELRSHTQGVYDRIMDFLGLPATTVLGNNTVKHETEKRHEQLVPMPYSIRKQLADFYEPYNQRLYKLLNWSHVHRPWE